MAEIAAGLFNSEKIPLPTPVLSADARLTVAKLYSSSRKTAQWRSQDQHFGTILFVTPNWPMKICENNKHFRYKTDFVTTITLSLVNHGIHPIPFDSVKHTDSVRIKTSDCLYE